MRQKVLKVIPKDDKRLPWEPLGSQKDPLRSPGRDLPPPDPPSVSKKRLCWRQKAYFCNQQAHKQTFFPTIMRLNALLNTYIV